MPATTAPDGAVDILPRPTLTREAALAVAARRGDFHAGQCAVSYGATGRARPTVTVETWRVNGAVRTWKRDPERFEIPIKYGLRGYATIDGPSLYQLHAADACPVEARAQAWYEDAAHHLHDSAGNRSGYRCEHPAGHRAAALER